MTLKVCGSALLLAFGLSSVAKAQAAQTQVRPISGQVGVGFSFAKPDYGSSYIKGVSGYGDIDFRHRVGVEADVQYDSLFTPTDIGEKTYMAGPRVTLVRQDLDTRRDFLKLYVKALGGLAQFQYQQGTYPKTGSDNYAALALGGGIDLHVSKHFNVRPVDVEWQKWQNFRAHGLNPIVTTFGAGYSF